MSAHGMGIDLASVIKTFCSFRQMWLAMAMVAPSWQLHAQAILTWKQACWCLLAIAIFSNASEQTPIPRKDWVAAALW